MAMQRIGQELPHGVVAAAIEKVMCEGNRDPVDFAAAWAVDKDAVIDQLPPESVLLMEAVAKVYKKEFVDGWAKLLPAASVGGRKKGSTKFGSLFGASKVGPASI